MHLFVYNELYKLADLENVLYFKLIGHNYRGDRPRLAQNTSINYVILSLSFSLTNEKLTCRVTC